jgi:hypothetical protein
MQLSFLSCDLWSITPQDASVQFNTTAIRQLDATRLEADDVLLLSGVLRRNRSIDTLDLRGQCIGSVGAQVTRY